MKNYEVIELADALSRVRFSDIRSGEFQYALSKNKQRIEKERTAIFDAIEACKSDRLKELQSELLPMIRSKIEGRQVSKLEVANIEKTVINGWDKKTEYEAVLKEADSVIAEIEQKESDFRPYAISKEVISALPFNDVQMSAIFPFVTEGSKSSGG